MTGQTLGRIVSVNVGVPRSVEWHGREVTSAIWKSPVDGPVAVRGHNLAGDRQADLRVHGGADKAVYAYAVEDYDWWAEMLPLTDFSPATFGENLTTRGFDPAQAVIGERWRVGSAILEVCQPRFPCAKLGMRMGDTAFVDRFAQARRPGAYLRIVDEGVVQADDRVTMLSRPDHGLRILDLVVGQRDRDAPTDLLKRIAANDLVPEGYRAIATRALARR
ncbi:MAG: MOSC domain-containing protein [Acidimicrobiales bacterium]